MRTEKIKKLFRSGFFHIIGSSAVNKIISFLSSFVLVRILTKSEYGTYTYAWNIYSLLVLMSGMGMDSAVLQIMSERSGDEQYGKRISAFGMRFGLAVNFFLSLLILFIGLFADLKIAAARGLLIMLCALPLLQVIINIASANLRATRKN